MIQIDHEGHTRDFILHMPAGYDSSKPTALVFAFHGYVNDSDEMFYQNGWGPVSDEQNFIVVVPNGADDDGG